jgi:RNA-directed DNA polymerase
MLAPPPFLVVFPSEERLLLAASQSLPPDEAKALQRLIALRRPPVTSVQSLALLFGFSPSLIGAMVRNPSRYYRKFEIRSGTRTRQIHTPKVALKIIQRWFGHYLSHAVELSDHVHGFVPNRSTVTAARQHCPAQWILSLDIRNFFGSVTAEHVFACLSGLGYERQAAHLMTDLCTMPLGGRNRGLPQGAPSSPVLANLAFRETDKKLKRLAEDKYLRISRYADDISVSGHERPGSGLQREIVQLIEMDGWVIAQNKTRLAELPRRHPRVLGLLVDQSIPRLPKRYRNRLRMMRHMLETDHLTDRERASFAGHVAYAESIR